MRCQNPYMASRTSPSPLTPRLLEFHFFKVAVLHKVPTAIWHSSLTIYCLKHTSLTKQSLIAVCEVSLLMVCIWLDIVTCIDFSQKKVLLVHPSVYILEYLFYDLWLHCFNWRPRRTAALHIVGAGGIRKVSCFFRGVWAKCWKVPPNFCPCRLDASHSGAAGG